MAALGNSLLTYIQMFLKKLRIKEWSNFLSLAIEIHGLMLVQPKHFRRGRVSRLLITFVLVFIVSGCATYRSDFLLDDDTIGVPFSSVGSYGNGIGIPRYRLNGKGSGYALGWGTSGTSCCVLLPKKITPVTVTVTVTWETYRSNVDESINHAATVPVHFADSAGKSSGLYVHFLPGHKVELWVSWLPPQHPDYLGPKFPQKPGPRYLPLPGEKSENSTPVIDGK